MKVILSRKGFDSSVGGHASPILPGGEMLSLPIPSALDCIDYAALKAPQGRTIGGVIADLQTNAKIAGQGAHMDPDLLAGTRERSSGWRPSLGQIGAAAGHLRNQQVSVGDLFLFYGWFRHTELHNGQLRFCSEGSGFHAIYGYLEIGDIIRGDSLNNLPGWLHDHPHAVPGRIGKTNNVFYVAAPDLSLQQALPGAGVFEFNQQLMLSKPGESRSRWSLDPALFRDKEISYHTDKAWRDGYFQSYPRAQEYVIEADGRVEDWARKLLTGAERWEV